MKAKVLEEIYRNRVLCVAGFECESGCQRDAAC